MSPFIDEAKDEYLAQLGIKRGSRLWPLMALGVLFAGLLVAVVPDDNTASTLYAATCRNAETTLAKAAESGAVPDEKLRQFQVKCGTNDFQSRSYETRLSDFVELMENHVAPQLGGDVLKALPAYVQLLAGYLRNEFASDLKSSSGKLFRDHSSLLATTALIACVPGLLGLIYRRDFWWWFLIAFVPLFVVRELAWLDQNPEKPLVSLFYLVVLQIVVLTLAFRLRRYSGRSNAMPAAVHNGLLAAGLLGVAGAWSVTRGETPLLAAGALYQWEAILIGLPLLYTLLRRSDVWSGQAAKNIVVCLDGTTNTPDQYEFGRLAQTNVFKLFKALKSDPAKTAGKAHAFNATFCKRYGDRQIALYYSGVGNRFDNNPITQVLGGATGLGAADVVARAYLDVIRVYQPGDRIFLFGFSRGAAIARLLARAIDQRGAPQTVWTLNLFGRHRTVWTSKRSKQPDLKVPVTVLGCWDTVGSFGIGKNIGGIKFQKLDLFKDLTVPDNVEQAYHMVALDEMREEFQPTLMEPDPISPGRIVEVWFSGDHANIGGGWATSRLSDLTLDFVLSHVTSGYAASAGSTPGDESWGLYVNAVNASSHTPDTPEQPEAFKVHPDPLGQVRRWNSALFNYMPRRLPSHAVLAESVFERIKKATPLYAPQSLFDHHRALSAKRSAVGGELTSLAETGSLSPSELDQILAINNSLRLTRYPNLLDGAELRRLSEGLKNSVTEVAVPVPVT